MKLHSHRNYVDLYEQKPKAIKSFGIRISPLLEAANIKRLKPQNIEKLFTPNIPAWCMKQPEILFDLHSGNKSESNPHILKDDFRKLQKYTMHNKFTNYFVLVSPSTSDLQFHLLS